MTDRLIVSDKERDSVLGLDDSQRYSYLIKRVADWESAWGLWEAGWALVADDAGRTGFPIWPAKEYAGVCAAGEWATYVAETISLEDLLGELMSRLRSSGTMVAVFPTPSSKGVLVEAERFEEDLRAECEQYE